MNNGISRSVQVNEEKKRWSSQVPIPDKRAHQKLNLWHLWLLFCWKLAVSLDKSLLSLIEEKTGQFEPLKKSYTQTRQQLFPEKRPSFCSVKITWPTSSHPRAPLIKQRYPRETHRRVLQRSIDIILKSVDTQSS